MKFLTLPLTKKKKKKKKKNRERIERSKEQKPKSNFKSIISKTPEKYHKLSLLSLLPLVVGPGRNRR